MPYLLSVPRPRRPVLYIAIFMVVIIAGSLSLFPLTRKTLSGGWITYGQLGDYLKENKFKYNFFHDLQEDTPRTPAPWDSSHFIVGEPTPSFRDNLRNDTYYITAWSIAGFTNQFIGYVNLIYLAMLTERVPIMPPFAPDHHISTEGGILPFGEVFNLTHLRSTLRIPLLEWKDIKELPSSSASNPYSISDVEDIGCWSTRPQGRNPHRADNLVHHLGLDPSYTRVPSYTRENERDHNGNHLAFSKLAALLHPRGPIEPASNFPIMMPSWRGKKLGPDEKLSCIDVLYYMTSGAEVFEWRFPWSPAWNFIGKHVTFNQWLIERSKGYILRAFGLGEDEEVPLFIAIHIRRGDFASQCALPGHCLVPLRHFALSVKKMEQNILDTKGIVVSRWLVSSDETDPNFWEEIRAQGWSFFDHEKEGTRERFGEWQTPLVDIVAHSLAAGFVGTSDSTFSLVSGRRVEDWNNGTYELVN